MQHDINTELANFSLGTWRRDSRGRRESFRSAAILAVKIGRGAVPAILAAMRQGANYLDMKAKDRDAFRQGETCVRRIAEHHALLTPEEWGRFLEGQSAPSSVSKLLRERAKKRGG